MNIFAVIILSTLFFDFFLNLFADFLNLKNLSGELPEEFKDVYDRETYKKSQDYTRVNTIFGIFISCFNLTVILVFWFAGGFNFLDSVVRDWNFHPIWSGLTFIGILILLKTLLSLPFSIISTFLIEERFGFNKTTTSTYVFDLLKKFALTILFGAPLLACILAFFQYVGVFAWLYCWIATSLFILFIHFIAPTWIMPLFNKFNPLGDGELRNRIMTYVESVHFLISDVFIMDGSKRSSKSNAFFTGFGRNKRIVLYDTLVEKHTVPELVAVLAHEIGHYKKKHILQGIIISVLHTGVMFFLLSVFLTNEGLFKAFYMEKVSVYAGFVFFGMLYTPIELVLSIFMNMLSRKNEYQADRFASKTIENPETMVNALKTLSVDNLSNLMPHALYVFLHYSHPPVLKRIEAIRRM